MFLDLRRYITPSDLQAPYNSPSTANNAVVVAKPADARLRVPLGFQVKLFASGLDNPRLIRVAPNGDIFITESGAGRIRVLRPSDGGDEWSRNSIFASGLSLPFGIAFYPSGEDPQWLYVANTDSVVRFRYHNGDLHANEEPEVVVRTLPDGGHASRDIAFSVDDTTMFVSVGSLSNDAESMAAFDWTSPREWIAFLRHLARNVVFCRSSTRRERARRCSCLQPERRRPPHLCEWYSQLRRHGRKFNDR